jgi:5-methylcytosine-specific restriction endonuclease McrA
MSERNWKDPEYRAWRKKVLKRDSRKCQFNKCGAKKKLQVHHIIPYSHNLAMSLNPNNGITLCKAHHKLITTAEQTWAPYFIRVVNENNNR